MRFSSLVVGMGLAVPLLPWSVCASDAPIIGIVSVPTDKGCETALAGRAVGQVGGSCFHALYVKYIESAGGRVAPIRYDADEAELGALFDSVNGILFTGGGVDIGGSPPPADAAQYLRATTYLFNRTVAANEAGDYVPLWGTCMGLQTLSIIAAGGNPSVLEQGVFDSEDISLPLQLTSEARGSRLLGMNSTPPAVLRWLTTENITSNLHHDGVAPSTFLSNPRLRDFFKVLSTNVDRRGRPFVSTIEGRRHRVYATQWHPERPQFEWKLDAVTRIDQNHVNHGPHAIESMQYMANFFVGESRRNRHEFPAFVLEQKALIYNYIPHGDNSYQAYFFPPASRSPSQESSFELDIGTRMSAPGSSAQRMIVV